jgi:hypothetical protein
MMPSQAELRERYHMRTPFEIELKINDVCRTKWGLLERDGGPLLASGFTILEVFDGSWKKRTHTSVEELIINASDNEIQAQLPALDFLSMRLLREVGFPLDIY